MMNDDKIMAIVLFIIAVFILVLVIVALELQRGRLERYDGTIAEYMMCIKYNSDCDCSGIILSEYNEEVE